MKVWMTVNTEIQGHKYRSMTGVFCADRRDAIPWPSVESCHGVSHHFVFMGRETPDTALHRVRADKLFSPEVHSRPFW